jgi:hypothetical protein
MAASARGGAALLVFDDTPIIAELLAVDFDRNKRGLGAGGITSTCSVTAASIWIVNLVIVGNDVHLGIHSLLTVSTKVVVDHHLALTNPAFVEPTF